LRLKIQSSGKTRIEETKKIWQFSGKPKPVAAPCRTAKHEKSDVVFALHLVAGFNASQQPYHFRTS
jgi:hypothetical protein